jgi:hypothetical protein
LKCSAWSALICSAGRGKAFLLKSIVPFTTFQPLVQ